MDNVTPRLRFNPRRKDPPVPTVWETGKTSEPVWTQELEHWPCQGSNSGRPVRNQKLQWLRSQVKEKRSTKPMRPRPTLRRHLGPTFHGLTISRVTYYSHRGFSPNRQQPPPSKSFLTIHDTSQTTPTKKTAAHNHHAIKKSADERNTAYTFDHKIRPQNSNPVFWSSLCPAYQPRIHRRRSQILVSGEQLPVS